MTFGRKLKKESPSNKSKKKASDYALWLLSLRAYTKKQLLDKLATKGYSAEEISEALFWLTKKRLVDDLRFAKDFIEYQGQFRSKSQRLMSWELLKKGVSKDLISQAFKEYSNSNEAQDDLARGSILIAKTIKKRLFQAKKPEEKKRYLLALLARKGFSYQTAKEILVKMK